MVDQVVEQKNNPILHVIIDKVFTIGGQGHWKSTLLLYCQTVLMIDQVVEN